jgi:hypothetical protein
MSGDDSPVAEVDADERDSDELPADGGEGRARRRRTIYLSETVLKDGEAVRLDEVLVVEDENDDDLPEDPPEHDPFWSPDREADPWVWETWWKGIMQKRYVGGPWRGRAWERQTWYCQLEGCGRPIPDVKSRGRPPKYCSKKHTRAAYEARNPGRRAGATKRPNE